MSRCTDEGSLLGEGRGECWGQLLRTEGRKRKQSAAVWFKLSAGFLSLFLSDGKTGEMGGGQRFFKMMWPLKRGVELKVQRLKNERQQRGGQMLEQ